MEKNVADCGPGGMLRTWASRKDVGSCSCGVVLVGSREKMALEVVSTSMLKTQSTKRDRHRRFWQTVRRGTKEASRTIFAARRRGIKPLPLLLLPSVRR